MTSLATLTHAAMAPSAFNHDFYTTAATVIPALSSPSPSWDPYTGSCPTAFGSSSWRLWAKR